MPQKALQKTRIWGTRFDPLPSSPPASPQLDNVVAAVPQKITEDTTEMPLKEKDDKTPHDSSIFVGSLPCNVDQQELARLLSDHLSEYSEIKNIKVVRDSKGGICAFVQCEDAPSAACLLRTLQSAEPRPFLGRVLRYEPARAFRTLLISYRTPVQFIPSSSPDSNIVDDSKSKYGELELPFAMRLWRPWKAKYTSIQYNAEARNAEAQVASFQGHNELHAFHKPTLYLDPLNHDVETIHKIASHFGSLEYFGAVTPSPSLPVTESNDDHFYSMNSRRLYPGPHNVPRSSIMDPGCWEVKWTHRDDCVSAWMTLRRVPHLTVTWAHHPSSYGFDSRPVAPPYFGYQDHQCSSASLPFHDQAHAQLHGERTLPAKNHIPLPLPPSLSMPDKFPDLNPGTPTFNSFSSENWNGFRPSQRKILTSHDPDIKDPSLDTEKGNTEISFGTSGMEWTEMDFPPLGELKEERRTETGVWADKRSLKANHESIGSPACTTTSDRTAHVVQLSTTDAIPHITSSSRLEEEHDVDFLPTPDLGMSPITPKTPGSMFPDTPTCGVGDFPTPTLKNVDGKDLNAYYSDLITEGERELDPTAIFVGGLEAFGPSAWDEQKLRQFFTKFGVVENVKFVRPSNGRSAFAFVKFNDVHAPARAVHEAHNSIHDGRQMRVQIRDCNPSHRTAWKPTRNRGKYQQSALQHSHPENSVVRHCPVPKTGVHEQHQGFKSARLPDRHISGDSAQISASTEFPTLNNNDTVGPKLPCSPANAGKNMNEPFIGNAQGYGRSFETSASNSSLGASAPPSSSQHEGYREWYEEPTNPTLPSPAPFSLTALSVAPQPFIPYPTLNMGFYPPPAWVHPLPPFPFPTPYMAGYAGFTLPALQPNALPSPSGPDSGPSASTQNTWAMSGLYGSYVPYTVNAQGTDQPQMLQTAPLVPTGFIHGEQGTLIAVYHPEALDQYMSTSQPAAPPLPNTQSQSGLTWQQPTQPQPSCFVPQPAIPPSLPSQTFLAPQSGTGVGWISGLSPQSHLPPPLHPFNATPDPLSPHRHNPGFRTANCDVTGHSQLSRRNQRDNGNRSNRNRAITNRLPRGNGGNADQAVRQTQINPPQFASFPTEWGQWAVNR